MPKSDIKINKDGVHYTSNVDRVSYTIDELTRAALKDVAKLLRTRGKQKAPKDSGNYKKNLATWVRKDRVTGEIGLHFGIYNAETSRKKNKVPVYYAHILEFGSRFFKGLGILRGTVTDSIDDIKRIEGHYLSAIENENKAIGLIKEEDEIKDES